MILECKEARDKANSFVENLIANSAELQADLDSGNIDVAKLEEYLECLNFWGAEEEQHAAGKAVVMRVAQDERIPWEIRLTAIGQMFQRVKRMDADECKLMAGQFVEIAKIGSGEAVEAASSIQNLFRIWANGTSDFRLSEDEIESLEGADSQIRSLSEGRFVKLAEDRMAAMGAERY